VAANSAELLITVRLSNADVVADKNTAGAGHTCVLLVGDRDNTVVYKARVRCVFNTEQCLHQYPQGVHLFHAQLTDRKLLVITRRQLAF